MYVQYDNSRRYSWRKKTPLIYYLQPQKGLQVVCETFQSDSISPKATISGCHRGNSLDGSLSSQTSQERGPSHSRYMTAIWWRKMYFQILKTKYAFPATCIASLSLQMCKCMIFVYIFWVKVQLGEYIQKWVINSSFKYIQGDVVRHDLMRCLNWIIF